MESPCNNRLVVALGARICLSRTIASAFLGLLCFYDLHDQSSWAAAGDTSKLVCSIPVGGPRGVQYRDVEVPDGLPWGPNSFAVDSDGSFLIADTAGDRILKYRSNCAFVRSIPLPREIVAASDLVFFKGIWVLDAASPKPAIYHLAADGKVLGKFDSPISLAEGLTGLFAEENGNIFVQQNFGEATLLVASNNKAKAGSDITEPVPEICTGR